MSAVAVFVFGVLDFVFVFVLALVIVKAEENVSWLATVEESFILVVISYALFACLCC